MGRVMVVSISSGPTFGQLVMTTTVGNVILGRRSMGRRVRQMAPRSTSAAIRIVTATGRVTENLATFMALIQPRGARGARGKKLVIQIETRLMPSFINTRLKLRIYPRLNRSNLR